MAGSESTLCLTTTFRTTPSCTSSLIDSRLTASLMVNLTSCRTSTVNSHHDTTQTLQLDWIGHTRSSMVCPSVCLSRSSALQKRLNRSRCRLGYGLGWSQRTIYQLGVQIPQKRGQFLAEGQFWGGKWLPIVSRDRCSNTSS